MHLDLVMLVMMRAAPCMWTRWTLQVTSCQYLKASTSVQEHLDEVLPAVLNGLADEAEGVREAALAAGRTAVDLYALSALPLLLPAVEEGIIDDNWRIRQSSVELLGDLLFKVS